MYAAFSAKGFNGCAGKTTRAPPPVAPAWPPGLRTPFLRRSMRFLSSPRAVPCWHPGGAKNLTTVTEDVRHIAVLSLPQVESALRRPLRQCPIRPSGFSGG